MYDLITAAHVILAIAGGGTFLTGFWLGERGPLPKAAGLMLVGTLMTVVGLLP